MPAPRPRPAAAGRTEALRVLVVAPADGRAHRVAALLSGPGFTVSSLDAGLAGLAGLAAAVQEHGPDVVVVALADDGAALHAVEAVMAGCPRPLVVCTRSRERTGRFIAAGAVEVLDLDAAPPGSAHQAQLLRGSVALAARVRVITHPRGRLPSVTPPGPAPRAGAQLLVIGASTGGPAALATILRALPSDFPLPVVVVQHMSDGFVEGLATWLATSSHLAVTVATPGAVLRPLQVVLAPAEHNLLVRRGLRVAIEEPAAGQHHVPGIDVTMASVAQVCGQHAIGVLLTGMGRDGAAGLRALRERGAPTFAQDEASSAVWGMPGAAVALDAADAVLPPAAMAAAIATAAAELAAAGTRTGTVPASGPPSSYGNRSGPDRVAP